MEFLMSVSLPAAIAAAGVGLCLSALSLFLAESRGAKFFPWFSDLAFLLSLGFTYFALCGEYRAETVSEDRIAAFLTIVGILLGTAIVFFHVMSAFSIGAPSAGVANLLLHDVLFVFLLMAQFTIAKAVLIFLISVTAYTFLSFLSWKAREKRDAFEATLPEDPAPAAEPEAEPETVSEPEPETADADSKEETV
ncbi:MAG: hypothetical protein MJ082_03655 [Clostridia bacterium]|nr:hypothetical protein [Clostridia bacterium]